MSSLLDSAVAKRALAASLALPLVALTGQASAESPWKDGEHVYIKVCGHCHEAGIGPQLKGRHLPPAFFVAVARQGLRAMPAFPASFIDDNALQQVAEYISNAPAPAAKP